MNSPSRLIAGLILTLVVTACTRPGYVPVLGDVSTPLTTPPATLAPTLTMPAPTPTPAAAFPTSTPLSHNPPATCRTTSPPDVVFTPPTPYPAKPPSSHVGEFWYGTADLWTMLPVDGIWSDLPHSGAGYTQKIVWWAQDYNGVAEPTPKLTVTGRRLDAAASPLVASGANNATADFGTGMLVGVDIPAPGCWEITGRYKGRELIFVIWIAP